MKACNIDTESWETFADDRTLWKQQVSEGLKRGEDTIQEKNDERWARRTASHQQDHQDPHQASVFTCQGCSRDCKSRIGLYSHTRCCSSSSLSGCYSIVDRLTDANNSGNCYYYHSKFSIFPLEVACYSMCYNA